MQKYYLNSEEYSEERAEERYCERTSSAGIGGLLLADKEKRAFDLLETIADYLGHSEKRRLNDLLSSGYTLKNIRGNCSEPMERTLRELEYLVHLTGGKNADFDETVSQYKQAAVKYEAIRKSSEQGPMAMISQLSDNPMLKMLSTLNLSGNSEGGMDISSLLPLLGMLNKDMDMDSLGSIMSMFGNGDKK